MAGVESMVEKQTNQNVKVIDREKTCPLLLRVFCSTGRHHSTAEFAHGNVPTNEVSYDFNQQSIKMSKPTILQNCF